MPLARVTNLTFAEMDFSSPVTKYTITSYIIFAVFKKGRKVVFKDEFLFFSIFFSEKFQKFCKL